MAKLPILQPDGRFAIWDTMMGKAVEPLYKSDGGISTRTVHYGGFIAFDCTFDDAVAKVDGRSLKERQQLCREALNPEPINWLRAVGDVICRWDFRSDMAKEALARTPDKEMALLFAERANIMLNIAEATEKLDFMQGKLAQVDARMMRHAIRQREARDSTGA